MSKPLPPTGSPTKHDWDVTVVGGGPSGSTTATLLARRGWRVALFERSLFPRFQIGESLLPGSMGVLDEAGSLPLIEAAGFMPKPGASFFSEKLKVGGDFPFRDAIASPGARKYAAFNVTRAKFDQILLDHAHASGVTIFQPYYVDHCTIERAAVAIGGNHRAKVVIWANGIGNDLLAPQNYVTNVGDDRNTAVFGYFAADFSRQSQRGNVIINLFGESVDTPPCWAWCIPLRDDLASVGFTIASDTFKELWTSKNQGTAALSAKKKLQAIGTELLKKNPNVMNYVDITQQHEPFQQRHNFQRVARSLVFDRQLLVGDAAGFIDPVFSSGIHLGLHSAKLAADTVHRELAANGDFSSARLQDYEVSYSRVFSTYYRIVKAFYQRNFVERIFLDSSPDPGGVGEQKRRQFTAILSGDITSDNPLLDSFRNCKVEINPAVAVNLEKQVSP